MGGTPIASVAVVVGAAFPSVNVKSVFPATGAPPAIVKPMTGRTYAFSAPRLVPSPGVSIAPAVCSR